MTHQGAVAEREAPVTTESLLAQKHAAEQAVLAHQANLVAERQKCETRIEQIDAELKATGWTKPRKPRTTKAK